MKLIENYVYYVTRFLSKKEEIGKEVTELIYSMLEEKYGYKDEYLESEVVAVLKELGNPNLLAIRYSNLPRQIVSEKYTTQFYYILFFVLIFVFVGGLFGFVFQTATDPVGTTHYLFEYLGSVVFSAFTAFGVLTFIFILIEKNQKEVKFGSSFNPLDLKDTSKAKNSKAFSYKMSDTITSIVFGFLGILGLYAITNYKVLYINSVGDGLSIGYRLFETGYWNKIVWILGALIVLDIIVNIALLIRPHKTVRKVTLVYVFGLACSIVSALILATPKLLDPTLLAYLAEKEFFVGLTLEQFNAGFPKLMLGIIGITVLVLTIVYFYNISRLVLMKPQKK